MNRINAGTPGTVAHAGDFLPTAYARRLARVLILKAAVSGRISWHVALPILNRIGGVA